MTIWRHDNWRMTSGETTIRRKTRRQIKTIGRKIIRWQTKTCSESEKKDQWATKCFTKDDCVKDVQAKDYLATRECTGSADGISLLSFIQAELIVMSYRVMSSRVCAEIRVLAFWEPLFWISDLGLRLHLTVWPRKHGCSRQNFVSNTHIRVKVKSFQN